MNLAYQAERLCADLSQLDLKSKAPWRIALAFNTLLEIAKKEHPEDPVIAALQPFVQSTSDYADDYLATVAVAAGQLYASLP